MDTLTNNKKMGEWKQNKQHWSFIWKSIKIIRVKNPRLQKKVPCSVQTHNREKHRFSSQNKSKQRNKHKRVWAKKSCIMPSFRNYPFSQNLYLSFTSKTFYWRGSLSQDDSKLKLKIGEYPFISTALPDTNGKC